MMTSSSTSSTPATQATPATQSARPGVMQQERRLLNGTIWSCRYFHPNPHGEQLKTQKVLLMLHGGPGMSSAYLEPWALEMAARDYQVYVYDQADSGKSQRHGQREKWTIEYYTQEIEEVRKELGLEDFILCGHSWAAMIAAEYAIKYQGKQLRALILANMLLSIPLLNRALDELRKSWPKEAQEIIDKYEAKGDFENPGYQAVMDKHYFKVLCLRQEQWPKFFTDDFANANAALNDYILGPNPLRLEGTAKEWDIMGELPKIKVPTLLLGSRYDYFPKKYVELMYSKLSNGSMIISENGSHCSFIDDAAFFYPALDDWIKRTVHE